MCSPKPLKARFWCQNLQSEPCFCGDHISVHPHIRFCSRTSQTTSVQQFTMASKEPEVIDIPDDEEGEDDWQDISPINVAEAKAYKEKVDEIV